MKWPICVKRNHLYFSLFLVKTTGCFYWYIWSDIKNIYVFIANIKAKLRNFCFWIPFLNLLTSSEAQPWWHCALQSVVDDCRGDIKKLSVGLHSMARCLHWEEWCGVMDQEHCKMSINTTWKWGSSSDMLGIWWREIKNTHHEHISKKKKKNELVSKILPFHE